MNPSRVTPPAGKPRRARSVYGRAALFLGLFAVLQGFWQSQEHGALYRVLVEDGIVAPAGYLIGVLTPHLPVVAMGHTLRRPGGGINIVNGCDGMETVFLLTAAFAAAPLTRRARWIGGLIGLLLVYALNEARILALFYSQDGHPELFDVLHSFLAPLIMILAVGAYFCAWLFQDERTPLAV
jgi:exosortase/archaeosortase family protein